MWIEITLVVVLTLVNAALSGSEMAFVSLRESQISRLAAESERGRQLAKLTADPDRFLSTIQVGITLAGFLASAVAAVSLSAPLVDLLEPLVGAAAEPLSVVAVTLVLSYLTLVVGELTPKRIAMQRAQGWALRAARPINVLALVTRPLVWMLARSTSVLVRAVGLDPNVHREEVTEDEIKDMIAAAETIPAEQRSIIAGAMEIDERRLWQVLVPRSEVVFLPGDASATSGCDQLIESGVSRAPVTGVDEDDVLGIVHLRELVSGKGTVADHVRSAVVLPETVGVLGALAKLRSDRSQMALVVDEFGAIAGIVTVEDLLEEIVGEIYDEFDPDTTAVVQREGGELELTGSFPAHDLPDLGVEVEPGRYATIAGLVLERLGRIPTVGESVKLDGWRATVLEANERAVLRVKLTPTPAVDPDVTVAEADDSSTDAATTG